MSGQAVRSMRGRDAIYHLLVQDDAGGRCLASFSTEAISKGG